MKIDNLYFFNIVIPALKSGKNVRLRVKGRSMTPLLRDGKDLVELTPCHKVRRGDLILTQPSPGIFILHRVYRITPEYIILAGDGNLTAREKCTLSQVEGLVYRIIRGRKTFTTASFVYRIYSFLIRITTPLKWRLAEFILKWKSNE